MRYLRYLRFATYAIVLAIAVLLVFPRHRYIPLDFHIDPEEQRENAEYNAALTRLPSFGANRVQQILAALLSIRYPISFDDLCAKLGGRDSPVWCCTSTRGGSGRVSTYRLALHPEAYILVVDFARRPDDKDLSVVTRARLCFESAYGWRFAAESEDDFLGRNLPASGTS